MSDDDHQLTQRFDKLSTNDETQQGGSSQPEAPEHPRIQESNLFAGASHVSIEGESTLSSIGGSVYNINPVLSLAIGPETLTAQITPTTPPHAQASPPGIISGKLRVEREPEHDSEVYARLLLPKRLGWPLWLPRPRGTLPEAYKARGVDIGDVGLITADGEFDYFFNICLPADHPINRSKVPDNFEPLDIALTGEDVSLDPHAWPSGSHILNGGFKEKETSQGSQFQFEGSAPAGALLVSPLGGSRHDYLSLNVFVNYIKTHGKDWYRYINGPRGRRATNGSVYLVTGVDRARAWGTSSFSGLSGEGSFPLRFEEQLDRLTNPFPFTWVPSGYAATRHGPAFENEMQHRHLLPENQCIFLRGFRVALADSLWASLFKTVQVEATSILQSSPASLLQTSSYIPFGVGDSTGGGGLLNYFSTLRSGGSSQSRKTKSSSEDVIVISDLPTPSVSHPSDVINRRLLDNFEDATMAITHDSVWCSILQQDETSMPEIYKMLERIDANFAASCIDGLAQFCISQESQLLQDVPAWQRLSIRNLSRPNAEGKSSRSPSNNIKTAQSCKLCRRSKMKCDSNDPCGQCKFRGAICQYRKVYHDGSSGCTPCRNHKIRCDEKYPCRQCRDLGNNCISPSSLKKQTEQLAFDEHKISMKLTQKKDAAARPNFTRPDFAPL